MNRIDQTFARLRDEGKKALIVYLMGGDPDLDATERNIQILAENGADLIELGLPFSDPMAEGPVIQAASTRALQHGYLFAQYLAMVARIRRKGIQQPILLMNYYNLIMHHGEAEFVQQAVKAGIDGFIVPDLPLEEAINLKQIAKEHNAYVISFLAPTSGPRQEQIIQQAEGFLYCVSSRGVTGIRQDLSGAGNELCSQLNGINKVPKAIGFGIGSPEQAEALKPYADGVIIGSVVVQCIAEAKNNEQDAQALGNLIASFAEVMHKKEG